MKIEEIKEENFKTIQPKDYNDWLQERQKYITGTECLFAIQNFSSNENMRMLAKQIDHFAVSKEVFYKRKHLNGDMLKIYNDLNKNNAKEAGKKFEAEVAEIGRKLILNEKGKENAELVANGKNIFTIKKAGIAATPDYFLQFDKENIDLVECKTTTLDIEDDEIFKQIQQRYLFQCQCQMLCTGIKSCWLVVSKLNKNRTEILTTRIFKIDEHKKLQQELLDCCEKCLQWMKDVENGIVELEINEEKTKDEEILDNLYNNNLQSYLNEYGESMMKIKEQERHYENVQNIIKAMCYNNIKVEGWNIYYKIQNATFETIETLEEKIKKNEKEHEELKDKLEKLKENGDLKFLRSRLIIKNIQIFKVESSLN